MSLNIESRGTGTYRARGRHPNGPRASYDFALPLAEPGAGPDLLRTDGPTLAEAGLEAAATFGRSLRDRVLGSGLLEHIQSSVSPSGNGGHLQLLLNLSEAPELASVLWEYLWRPRREPDLPSFAGSPPLTVLRWMPQQHETRPAPTTPPLRMLVVISDPGGREKLAGDAEWDIIRDALYGHELTAMSKNLLVERLATPTVGALNDYLHEHDIHILHFVGHGELDENRGLGTLIFQESPAAEALGAPLDARRIQLLVGTRAFVSAPETCQRLPALTLPAGSILTYLAATLPAVPTGSWDRRPRPTPGRLRALLARADFPTSFPLPHPIRQKLAVSDHLPKGFWGQRRPPSPIPDASSASPATSAQPNVA